MNNDSNENQENESYTNEISLHQLNQSNRSRLPGIVSAQVHRHINQHFGHNEYGDHHLQHPSSARSFIKTNSLTNLLSTSKQSNLTVPGSSALSTENSLNPYRLLPPVNSVHGLPTSDDLILPPGSAMSTLSGLSGLSPFPGLSPFESTFVSPRHSAISGNRARKRNLSVSPLSIEGIDLNQLIRTSPNSLRIHSRGSSNGTSPYFGVNLSMGLTVPGSGGYGHLSARGNASPALSTGSLSRQLLIATPGSMIVPHNSIDRSRTTDDRNTSRQMRYISTDDYLNNAFSNVLEHEGSNHINYEEAQGSQIKSESSHFSRYPSQLVVTRQQNNMQIERAVSTSEANTYPPHQFQSNYTHNVKTEYMPNNIQLDSHSQQFPTSFQNPQPPPPYSMQSKPSLSLHSMSQLPSIPHSTVSGFRGNLLHSSRAHNTINSNTNTSAQNYQNRFQTQDHVPVAQVNFPATTYQHSHNSSTHYEQANTKKDVGNPIEGNKWVCRWYDCNQIFKVCCC